MSHPITELPAAIASDRLDLTHFRHWRLLGWADGTGFGEEVHFIESMCT